MRTDLLQRPQNEVTHNARVKIYPDGSQEVMVCSRPIFREDGWEAVKPQRKSRRQREPPEPDDRAQRRARAQVRDLARANPFRWFVTLTLDRQRIDRYDVTAVTAKLKHWLDNNVRRRGLAYVLVPEFHKDGAIHFHGLFNDALPVEDSGHKDRRGHTVYNLPRWSLGFSTAIALYGDYQQAVSYVCKYIGKGSRKVGGRWFYHGGDLQGPVVTLADLDFREEAAQPGAYTFEVAEAGAAFTTYFVRGTTDGKDTEANAPKGQQAHSNRSATAREPEPRRL